MPDLSSKIPYPSPIQATSVKGSRGNNIEDSQAALLAAIDQLNSTGKKIFNDLDGQIDNADLNSITAIQGLYTEIFKQINKIFRTEPTDKTEDLHPKNKQDSQILAAIRSKLDDGIDGIGELYEIMALMMELNVGFSGIKDEFKRKLVKFSEDHPDKVDKIFRVLESNGMSDVVSYLKDELKKRGVALPVESILTDNSVDSQKRNYSDRTKEISPIIFSPEEVKDIRNEVKKSLAASAIQLKGDQLKDLTNTIFDALNEDSGYTIENADQAGSGYGDPDQNEAKRQPQDGITIF